MLLGGDYRQRGLRWGALGLASLIAATAATGAADARADASAAPGDDRDLVLQPHDGLHSM